jgi:hypothetical protein
VPKKSSKKLNARRLPKRLEPFFWDYAFHRLSWERDRDLVIARVLEHGDWDAIQWLRARVPAGELRQWIINRQGRGLDARRLRFWELVLDLPHRQVNRWMATQRQSPWHQRTHRP